MPSEIDYTESHGTFSIDYVIFVLLPSDLAHYLLAYKTIVMHLNMHLPSKVTSMYAI